MTLNIPLMTTLMVALAIASVSSFTADAIRPKGTKHIRPSPKARLHISPVTSRRSSSLYYVDLDLEGLEDPLVFDTSLLLNSMFLKLNKPTPTEEEDIFANLSHFSLDIITVFAKRPLTIRAFLFIGRIFSISSEYVVTQHIRADELAFQTAMLAFSGTLFAMSLKKEFIFFSDNLSKAEMRLYSHLKHSLTPAEFKSLLTKTAEVKTFGPKATVINEMSNENNDYLLWLLEGSFDIVKNGELLRENVKKFDSRSHGFIGDVSFMDRLYSESIVGIPIATIVASGEGAKFLVFDGKKLRKEMKRCQRYDSCLRGFLARGMQKKISDLASSPPGGGARP